MVHYRVEAVDTAESREGSQIVREKISGKTGADLVPNLMDFQFLNTTCYILEYHF